MVPFPYVPKWWKNGNQFKHLNKGFVEPNYIIGFDTETCRGEIISEQFYSDKGGDILFVNTRNSLDKFLNYLKRNFTGYCFLYLFNAQFDLAIILRKYIQQFLKDKFDIQYQDWEINVFAGSKWFASFKSDKLLVRVFDIRSYFFGSLDTVSKSFSLDTKKLKHPDDLGYKKFTINDKKFVDYAITDAQLCYQMGNQICNIHKEFDIPISMSSANMAQKVFAKVFIKKEQQFQFPNWEANRIAEMSYHGGKNNYYLNNPAMIHKCYEYDFVSAYGYAMYSLPSFIEGSYQRVKTFKEDLVGHYLVEGTLKPCKYGIFYDSAFNYYHFDTSSKVRCYVTSYELKEAITRKEFILDSCEGWVWNPSTEENPLKEYASYFWEKKNNTKKGDVKYLFYKLLLNSLYGKWVQRNPMEIKCKNEYYGPTDQAGGLYFPFIGGLITGYTRARLHYFEHILNAIECSTDSVKTQVYMPSLNKDYFGRMKLEEMKCKKCDKTSKSFTGLFLRNRLNLLMDRKEHIYKCALHGFWGKPEQLLQLFKERGNEYSIERMPLIREGLTQEMKLLFQTSVEDRVLNIDWTNFQEL